MAGKSKKKKISVSLSVLLIALLIILLPCKLMTTVDNSLSLMSHTDKAPLMVAHRGLSSLAPENSIPAFEMAAEYGFDGYELDIHTTKDGKWVVIHDENLDRITDGSGPVNDMTLEEIRGLRLTGGNGIENYDPLGVPTLEEVLECNKDKDIIPVIEIKTCDVRYLPGLVEILDSYGLVGKAVIISFDIVCLEKYRALDGKTDMLYLTAKPVEEDLEWCLEYNAGINFHFANLFRSVNVLYLAEKKGITVGAWTVDNTVFEDVMVLFGVDIITTNKLIP